MRTLRSRMLIAFVGLALVPVVLIASLVVLGALRFAERRTREDLAQLLSTADAVLTRQIRAERVFLETLADRYAGQIDSGDDARPWVDNNPDMQRRVLESSSVTSRFLLLLAERNQALLIERSPLGAARALRTRELTLDSLRGAYRGLLASWDDDEPIRALTERRPTGPVLILAARLSGLDGTTTGLLAEELAALSLVEQVLSMPGFERIERGYAAARDDTGEWILLYDSDLTRIGTALSPVPEAGGEAAAFARERRFLSGARHQAATGWLLGVTVSMSPLLDPLRANVVVALALLGLVSALVVLGILRVTRGIGATVEQFASTTEAISRGEFDRTLRPQRADEFGVIAEHVNRMAQELRLTVEARAIARIQARVLHDIKGVVSQMKLMLHNLRRNSDDEEFRAESFGLMEGLIEHMESLSLRLRRGEPVGSLRSSEVELAPVVDALLSGPVLGSRPGIRAAHRLEPRHTVCADPELLGRVLENVIGNATEAMGERGELEIASGRGGAGANVIDWIEVRDSGPGMSRAFIDDELFRPFATTKPGGLGLGMYEARAAIQQLGGTIRVNSEPGRGTTVRIELPARSEGHEHDPAGR